MGTRERPRIHTGHLVHALLLRYASLDDLVRLLLPLRPCLPHPRHQSKIQMQMKRDMGMMCRRLDEGGACCAAEGINRSPRDVAAKQRDNSYR